MIKTASTNITADNPHPAARILAGVWRLAGLLAVLALPACSENIRQREQEISDVMERHRQILEEQQAARAINTRASRVDVPGDRAWLYRPYRATYRNQGLRETLERLTPGFPVAYALPGKYNPRVSSTPDAATVEDHLNAISLQANVGYEFHQGILLITPMVTREYEVPLYGGGSNIINVSSNNLGTGDNSAGGSGGFENNVSSQLSAQNDVHQLVNTVLGIRYCEQVNDSRDTAPDAQATPPVHTYNDQECYSISPTGNLLSITARPQRIVLFDGAYQKWLQSVTRQANIKITVVRLDVTDLAQQHVDLSLIRNASISASIRNITQDLASTEISAGGGVFSLKIDDPDSAWNSSEVILKALAQVGNMSIDDTKEVLVYNNRLVTIRNYRIHRYVERTSIQQTDAGGTSLSTPTVEIGELETGQAINILPTLTDDLIALHIVINEAKIDSVDTYDIAGSSGVLPTSSGNDNIFDVTIENGETVLLASTHREEVEVKTDRSGLLPVWPFNRLTGNSESGGKRLTQTLFLIQGSFRS